jgi:hypothetical protein
VDMPRGFVAVGGTVTTSARKAKSGGAVDPFEVYFSRIYVDTIIHDEKALRYLIDAMAPIAFFTAPTTPPAWATGRGPADSRTRRDM